MFHANVDCSEAHAVYLNTKKDIVVRSFLVDITLLQNVIAFVFDSISVQSALTEGTSLKILCIWNCSGAGLKSMSVRMDHETVSHNRIRQHNVLDWLMNTKGINLL